MDKIVSSWAIHEEQAGKISLVLGLLVVAFAPLGHFFKAYCGVTESLFAMLVGILFGSEGIGWFPFHEMEGAKEAFFEFTRLVIAIQVFNAAVFLDTDYLKRHWGQMARMVASIMLPMWLASTLCVYIVFQYDLRLCLIIGACLTPSDPILSSTVLKGKFAVKHLHAVVRETLTAESGANDLFAFAFIMLPMLLWNYNTSYAIGVWFYVVILYRVVMGALVGACIGAGIALIATATTKSRLADRDTKLILLIAVSAFTMGLALLIGVQEMVAVFAAGIAYNLLDKESDKKAEKQIDDAVDTMATFAFFTTFGTFIPWKGIARVGTGKLVVLSLLVLAIRRIPFPVVLNSLIFRPRRQLADMLAVGFFGPIGASAVFLGIFAVEELERHGLRDNNDIFDTACFVVVTQVAFYSITAPLAGRLYDRATGYTAGQRQGGVAKLEEQASATITLEVALESKDDSSPSS